MHLQSFNHLENNSWLRAEQNMSEYIKSSDILSSDVIEKFFACFEVVKF